MIDAATFDWAYRQYSRALVGVSRRMTNDSADAEDIAQSAWMRLWKYREPVWKEAIWTLLRRYLRYEYWSKRNDRVAGGEVEEERAPERLVEHGGDEVVAAKELHAGIDAMTVTSGAPAPDSMKTVVKLVLLHDDGPTVARIRGVSKQSVAQTMKSVIASLRRQWRIE